jgi:hypothetical protein
MHCLGYAVNNFSIVGKRQAEVLAKKQLINAY